MRHARDNRGTLKGKTVSLKYVVNEISMTEHARYIVIRLPATVTKVVPRATPGTRHIMAPQIPIGMLAADKNSQTAAHLPCRD